MVSPLRRRGHSFPVSHPNRRETRAPTLGPAMPSAPGKPRLPGAPCGGQERGQCGDTSDLGGDGVGCATVGPGHRWEQPGVPAETLHRGCRRCGARSGAPVSLSRCSLGGGQGWDRDRDMAGGHSPVRRRGRAAPRGRAHRELLSFLPRQRGRGDLGHQRDPGGGAGNEHPGGYGSQEGPSPQGGGGGVTYRFAFGTSVAFVAGSTGLTLGKGERLPAERWAQGAPTASHRGGDPQPPAPSRACGRDTRGDTSGTAARRSRTDPAPGGAGWGSGDTHSVTLGAGGAAGTLGARGAAGTGEAGSTSDARSALEEAEEAVREQHGPSSQSRGAGTLTVAPLAPG